MWFQTICVLGGRVKHVFGPQETRKKVMLTSGRHACKKQWSIDYCNIVSDMISCLQQYYSGTKKETVWHGQPYSYITRSPKFCIFKNKNQKLSPNTVSVENE